MKSAVFIAIKIIIVVAILTVIYFFTFRYDFKYPIYESNYTSATVTIPLPFIVTHIKTPDSVKAIYITSWVAGRPDLRSRLIDIVDTTEINSVVIDIKDYTGRISFKTDNEFLNEIGASEERISDIKKFIGELHDKGIYVIGRISSFQDSYLVHKKPEYAVRNKAGEVWKDFKGVSWLDPGAESVWNYLATIGDESYALGFDELNFDYIRFPSDGDMDDVVYPFSHSRQRRDVLKDYFAYLDKYFREKNIPISADLFGMTTSNQDDLGIGQILESALIHFDYVAPMVYPSHYPPNFNGWANPAMKPYEVIQYSMKKAYDRAVLASTSPMKLRPWLQDFSINGTKYTPEMVRAQIQATYDVGLDSWMLWNASNKYTVSALESASSSILSNQQ